MISKILVALVAPVLFVTVSCNSQKTEEAPAAAAPVTTEASAPEVTSPAATATAPAAPAVEANFGLTALTNPTDADLQRGAKVYKANCVRCHNADPNMKGSLGPEQIDAPFEVVVSKIMTGKYPESLPAGFTPKRKTRAMTPLKNLKADIPYIHAWIQSVKKK